MKYIILVILIITLSACENCSVNNGSNTGQLPISNISQKSQHQILNDSKYFKITKEYNDIVFEIKEAVEKPVLIKQDGTLLEKSSIEDITYDDMLDFYYIALPQNDNFINQLIDNPFKNIDFITPARPFVNGQFLNEEKSDKNTVIFKLNNLKANKKVIDKAKLTEIFPDYDKNLLGEGGQGKVYKVTYDGKEYALKENAQEYEKLEKLQSMNAVVKVFGTFEMDNKPYMLMELGQKTLADMNKNKEKLSDEQIIDATKSFKKLIFMQKKLGITNSDIKPANLLLSQDNKLKVIDMSDAFTKGYHGKESQLLARSLLENKNNISIKGGHIKLEEFFKHNKSYTEENIISADMLKYLNKIICNEIFPKDPRCQSIQNFDDLFPLISQEKNYEIALKVNERFENKEGSVDEYVYETNLPKPLVNELTQEDWEKYYQQKDKVIMGVCQKIIYIKKTKVNNKEIYNFEEIMNNKYENFFDFDDANNCKLKNDFTSADDDKFKQFIKDAFYEDVYKQTFAGLVSKYKFSDIVEKIFLELDENNPTEKAILDLYNYKP